MSDAADKVSADDERAMALFEKQRQQRIDESMRPYDPALPVQCVDCSAVISAERQAAQPRTNRCTTCAAEIEYRNGWGRPQ